MAVPTYVVSSDGRHVQVNHGGELVVGPREYSEPYQASVTGTTITNIIQPKMGYFFVITDIIVSQDRTNTDVQVDIFEADSETGAATQNIFTVDTAKNQVVPLTGLNLISTDINKWINFQTDSATAEIRVTVAGYFLQNGA
jgi:hypothetical protein